MDFQVDIHRDGDIGVLGVRGEVDVYTAPKLKAAVVETMEGGCVRLVVDLSEVGFMDSSGLGVLVSALKRTKDAGGALRLVCGDERVLKIFRITGLSKVFAIDASRESAMSAMGAAS